MMDNLEGQMISVFGLPVFLKIFPLGSFALYILEL